MINPHVFCCWLYYRKISERLKAFEKNNYPTLIWTPADGPRISPFRLQFQEFPDLFQHGPPDRNLEVEVAFRPTGSPHPPQPDHLAFFHAGRNSDLQLPRPSFIEVDDLSALHRLALVQGKGAIDVVPAGCDVSQRLPERIPAEPAHDPRDDTRLPGDSPARTSG